MDRPGEELFAVLAEARKLVIQPDNDFTWSSWLDADLACAELDELMIRVTLRKPVHAEVIFAPTGPMQELAISSGWGNEFVRLADRFDRAAAAYRRSVSSG